MPKIMVKPSRRNAAASKIQAAFRAKRNRGASNRPAAPRMSNPTNPTFGAVSTITSAPAAIGNSMSGFSSRVLQTSAGVRVIGRDYAFTPVATGTATGWTHVGGMPLTPACMPSTVLRNFVQMYNKFKMHTMHFHYITSSSTSSTGDVVFYFQKNSDSSFINCASNSFLPYVLSDSNTVIGPQWTNHTAIVKPNGNFKSTDYGMNIDDNYTFGDIHLFSKTSTTESPGYVIFDYDITFNELSVNPRAGFLPIIKAQWNQVQMVFTNVATAGTTVAANTSVSTNGIGATSITAFSGVIGDIYKVILDVTNSTFGATETAGTFFNSTAAGVTNTAFSLADGSTFYWCLNTTTTGRFYATLAGAEANSGQFVFGATATYNSSLRGFVKYMCSVNPTTYSAQY